MVQKVSLYFLQLGFPDNLISLDKATMHCFFNPLWCVKIQLCLLFAVSEFICSTKVKYCQKRARMEKSILYLQIFNVAKSLILTEIFHPSPYKHTFPLPPRNHYHISVRNVFPNCILIVTISRELCNYRGIIFLFFKRISRHSCKNRRVFSRVEETSVFRPRYTHICIYV